LSSSSRSDLQARLTAVRERIARAAGRARRDPSSVRLVAVSKTFDADAVRAVAEAGQIEFGENKVQEAAAKIESTLALHLRWHLIGHLQSNKARKAAAIFDVVQSVDSTTLLSRIDEAAAAAGKRPDLLVQTDLAGEATKFGAPESDLPAIFDAARTCRAARVVGLMVLPPAVDDPNEARPFFRKLKTIRATLLDSGIASPMLAELSMGMSHDFEVAVEEGATIVRVGSAIFGERSLSPRE
jgi:pyridoxal phosphate enzyme (YggS family)